MKKLIKQIFLVSILFYIFTQNHLIAQSWKEVDSIASEHIKMKNYEKAEKTYVDGLYSIEKSKGRSSKEYAILLGNLANFCSARRQFEKADSLFSISIDIFKNIKDTLSIEYANVLNNLADIYLENSFFEDAELLYTNALEIKRKTIGNNAPSCSFTLNQLGYLYNRMGQFKKSENCYFETLEIDKKNSGENSEDIAIDLNNIAGLYKEMGLYEKSEKVYFEALRIQELASGKNSINFAIKLNNLGDLYLTISQYKKAEQTLKASIDILENIKANNTPDYAYAMANLANLYMDIGEYEKAENICKQGVYARKNFYGNKHPEYAYSLETLAKLYIYMGEYNLVEKLLMEALEIKKNSMGEKNPDYARTLNNLAGVYRKTGRHQKAESLFIQSKEIRKEIYGDNHPSYATALNNLGVFYNETGKYNLSEKYFLEALKIIGNQLGKNSNYYAITLGNLAFLYDVTGKYDKAEEYYKLSLEIYKNNFGEKHPDYISNVNNLATVYMNMNDYDKAYNLFKKSNEDLLYQINNYYPSLSEKEKSSFLNTIYKKFERFYSFAVKYNPDNEFISEDLLNLRIATKGLILSSTSLVRNRILNSNDSALIELYNKWIFQRSEITRGYTLSNEEQKNKGINIYELENNANEIEKLLTTASEDFAVEKEKKDINCKEIISSLKPNQCVLEFIDFRFYDKKWTDSIIYYAVILKKDIKYPKLVKLCKEDDLIKVLSFSAESSKGYVKDIDNNYDLYSLIWKPIEPFLSDVNEILISPSGLLNKVSFSCLILNNNELLCDKFLLRYIGNMKDIFSFETKSNFRSDFRIALFGGAEFDIDTSELNSAKNKSIRGDDDFNYGTVKTENTSVWKWNFLPGTLKEIEDIKLIFNNKNIYVLEYKGKEACEDSLKVLNNKNSPNLIHISTHGYFFSEPNPDILKLQDTLGLTVNKFKLSENSLMRSGLILAGANRVWLGGEEIEGIENGIVTALEISNMDLLNTELVVLSACETGLGDIKGGEGVYGLQRAFKVAGAKTIIMSLWKVPDKETVELMELFYTNWLGGMTKHEAFYNAQKEMRKKYAPYYWAAFVMVE